MDHNLLPAQPMNANLNTNMTATSHASAESPQPLQPIESPETPRPAPRAAPPQPAPTNSFPDGSESLDTARLEESITETSTQIGIFAYTGKAYLAEGGHGDIVPHTEPQFIRLLIEKSVLSDPSDELKHALLNHIRLNYFATSSGPIAGYAKGWIKNPGEGRHLVTSEAALVKPHPGDFELLLRFLVGTLGEAQFHWLCHWIKFAWEALHCHKHRPMPAVLFGGAPDAGKTQLIELLSILFGNRVGHPLPFFLGQTRFNDDLMKAEVLVIDDELASDHANMREMIATGIRQYLFSGSLRVEKKFETAVTIRPIQFLLMALNPSGKMMRALPPLDDSLRGKMALLKTNRSPILDQVAEIGQWPTFRATLESQLPALLDYAIKLPVPPEWRHPRTGVVPWHDAELLEKMPASGDENRAERLIVDAFANHVFGPRLGPLTAAEIFEKLASSCLGERARKILQNPTQTGYVLRSLSNSHPHLVERAGRQGVGTMWQLRDPSGTGTSP